MTPLLVLVRLVVAALVLFGPWTDEPDEVADWDVGRFEEIATAEGTPYLDHDVEYPPASVALIELTHRADAARSLDRIVLVTLAADLATAALISRRWGTGALRWYLGLGTILLPATYLRFDIVAVVLAVAGWVAVADGRPRRGGVALAAAVMVKTWPALLVPPLLASGRWRAAVWSVAATGAAVVAWAVWAGVDGPLQVLSFRGATGWHVESTGGIVTVLWSGADAALEAGAYRVGSAPLAAKAVGALAVVAVTSAACVGVWLRSGEQAADGADEPAPGATAELAALASIAALLVASPLLSPQFLVWLTPWAAVAAAAGHRRIALVVAAACALTQVTLVAFSPAGLDATAPALLLGVRNALLGAAALSSVRILLAPRRATASDHQPAVTPGG